MFSIVLLIIDCLRYDRFNSELFGGFRDRIKETAISFNNAWSVSHCTDPAVTSLLSGKWPDEIGLYSMMFEIPEYTIPTGFPLLAETAKEHGYKTTLYTNAGEGRWYERGNDVFVNTRPMEHAAAWDMLVSQLESTTTEPHLTVFHDASCHTDYRGGDYDTACSLVNDDLLRVIDAIDKSVEYQKDTTIVIVMADHGEGLGERGVPQHGVMWPQVTHIPLLIHMPALFTGSSVRIAEINRIVQMPSIYSFMKQVIELRAEASTCTVKIPVQDYAYMVGRGKTFLRRAITDGDTMIIRKHDSIDDSLVAVKLDIASDKVSPIQRLGKMKMWKAMQEFAGRFGIDSNSEYRFDDIIEERLRALGYVGFE